VQIRGHRPHAGDREIEWRNRRAEFARERQKEAAHAGIDMEPETVTRRDFIDERLHGRRIGVEIDAMMHAPRGEAAHVGSFFQRGVAGMGEHDLERLLLLRPPLPEIIPRGLYRHEVALGAAGGDGAAGAGLCLQQIEPDVDKLALDFLDAGKRAAGICRVDLGDRGAGEIDQVERLVVDIVNGAEVARPVRGHIVHLKTLQRLQHHRVRCALQGKACTLVRHRLAAPPDALRTGFVRTGLGD
jgi:hypothetical protein